MAADGGEVVGVLVGESIQTLGKEFIQYGCVVTVEDAKLAQYTSDGYAQAVFAVIAVEKPEGIILGHTALGKDLAPRIASKLNSGLISDVTSIEEAGGNLSFTRPIYSGKAFEKKIVTDGVIFATIRPNNIEPLAKDESRTGDVSSLSVAIKDLRTIIKDVVRKATDGVDLSEAAENSHCRWARREK